MSAKTRLWMMILGGLTLGLIVWSIPSFAQDDSGDGPVFVLSVGTRSCTLALEGADEVEGTAEATTEANAVPRATYRPTLTPAAPAPSADATENATEGAAVGFNAGELVVYTLGDECDNVISQLEVPENGTLWLSISLQDDPNTSLPLSILVDDEFPPQLDRRGRFFGCEIQAQGEQICRVVVTVGDILYQIDVPVVVQGAFFAETNTPAPEAPQATNTPQPAPPPATTEQP